MRNQVPNLNMRNTVQNPTIRNKVLNLNMRNKVPNLNMRKQVSNLNSLGVESLAWREGERGGRESARGWGWRPLAETAARSPGGLQVACRCEAQPVQRTGAE